MTATLFLDSIFENDPILRKDIYNICHTIKKAGFQIYLIGGCVRDLILNKIPNDWDFVTSAKPEEIAKLFSDYTLIGNSFGVSLIKFGNRKYEIATYRSESTYSDGRHPDDVSFNVTLKEDIERRDFTINGIAYDIIENNFIDYYGGIEDIKNKIIRTIGKPRDRFKEDYLRVLRAYRFAIVLDFTLEERTKASADFHFDTALNTVSKERIQNEIQKIFFRSDLVLSTQYLDYNFFSKLFQRNSWWVDNHVSNIKTLSYFELFVFNFYQFFRIVTKDDLEEILKNKLKFSNKDINSIFTICEGIYKLNSFITDFNLCWCSVKKLQFNKFFDNIRNIFSVVNYPEENIFVKGRFFTKKVYISKLKNLNQRKD